MASSFQTESARELLSTPESYSIISKPSSPVYPVLVMVAALPPTLDITWLYLLISDRFWLGETLQRLECFRSLYRYHRRVGRLCLRD